MNILVFLHGTAIMHSNGQGKTREQRVRQVVDRDPSVQDFASYVPTDGAVSKLRSWARQGARILYLSSHRQSARVDLDTRVLRAHGFPEGDVLSRGPTRTYAEIVGDLMPDVFVEDDCESFGGQSHMAYPTLRPELQAQIKSIVVPEFGGLEHLPDELSALALC